MITDLFQTYQAAEAAMIAGEYSVELCRAYDAAGRAYYGAISHKRAEWSAIPYNAAKSSAETNADDTEDTDIDELRWLEIAFYTYRDAIDSGDYNADGSRAK